MRRRASSYRASRTGRVNRNCMLAATSAAAACAAAGCSACASTPARQASVCTSSRYSPAAAASRCGFAVRHGCHRRGAGRGEDTAGFYRAGRRLLRGHALRWRPHAARRPPADGPPCAGRGCRWEAEVGMLPVRCRSRAAGNGSLPLGVTGNTSDSGSEESRFEPWRGN